MKKLEAFVHGRDGFERSGPRVIVLGPPGTGKTKTSLDEFVGPAVQKYGPEAVLACTFSRSAAQELRQRLARKLRMPESRLLATCSTIHSEAWRRVRVFSNEPKLIDPETGKAKLKAGDWEPPEQDRVKHSTLALKAWDFARITMQTSAEEMRAIAVRFSKTREAAKQAFRASDFVAWIESYEKKKLDAGTMDYTDMLVAATRLPTRPLKLLLVDEFQDTSRLQWAVVEHWSKQAGEVVLVGDMDQAIHEWMGASPDLLSGHVTSGEWKPLVLSQSYRVPESAWLVARHIITRNAARIDAAYAPKLTKGTTVVVSSVDGWMKHCKDAHNADKEEGTAAKRVFILARIRKELDSYARELKSVGVPYAHEYAGSPWVGNAKRRGAAYAWWCCQNRSWCDAKSIRYLMASLPVRGTDWFTGNRKSVEGLVTGGRDDAIRWDSELLAGFNVAKLRESKLGQIIPQEQATAYHMGIKRVGVQCMHDAPAVVLTTMHASKGREAETVIISAACSYGVDKREMDAERRVLYVAATRTLDTLVVDISRGEAYTDLLEGVKAARKVAEVPF